MRLAIYLELVYRRDERGYSTDRAFILFLLALRDRFESLALIGRVDPEPGRAAYAIPAEVELIALPHYKTLKHLGALTLSLPRTLRALWRSLDGVDALWAIGPHPMSLPITVFAKLRRRRVLLGVRQDFPEYVRHRLPNRRWRPTLWVAHLLERTFRGFSRRTPAIVVGHDLFETYSRKGKKVLEIAVSLISEKDIAAAPNVRELKKTGPIRLLSVGRLDPEKAPGLLLDAFELLQEDGRPWCLTIVGTGPLEDELRASAERFGGAVEVAGYVPHGEELFALYRGADLFVHVSRTEGLPQVLVEAQALGLPIVGTDVGGVGAALDGGAAGLLVPPGDPRALADAVRKLMSDTGLRRALAGRGLELARSQTLEAQAGRVAEFIAG